MYVFFFDYCYNRVSVVVVVFYSPNPTQRRNSLRFPTAVAASENTAPRTRDTTPSLPRAPCAISPVFLDLIRSNLRATLDNTPRRRAARNTRRETRNSGDRVRRCTSRRYRRRLIAACLEKKENLCMGEVFCVVRKIN